MMTVQTRASLNFNKLGHQQLRFMTELHVQAVLAMLSMPQMAGPQAAVDLCRGISDGRFASWQAVCAFLQPYSCPYTPVRSSESGCLDSICILLAASGESDDVTGSNGMDEAIDDTAEGVGQVAGSPGGRLEWRSENGNKGACCESDGECYTHIGSSCLLAMLH
jgi:hypothetical protein